LLKVISTLLIQPVLGNIGLIQRKIIVSDSHHPFCTPTKHILIMRRRETKTFPKSTYAFGDAGIPGKSQNEIAPAETKTSSCLH
jgi:hypothetical protein